MFKISFEEFTIQERNWSWEPWFELGKKMFHNCARSKRNQYCTASGCHTGDNIRDIGEAPDQCLWQALYFLDEVINEIRFVQGTLMLIREAYYYENINNL